MNIRQVREKIDSVKNVKKITNAMELVSTIKMKRAQQVATEAKPYQTTLETMINELTANLDANFSPLLKTGEYEKGKELVILISTNKGLCGAYNFNLFRFLNKSIAISKTDFIVIGKKGALFVNKMGGNIVADFTSNDPLSSVPAIFDMILDSYLAKKYSDIAIFYNQYVSTLLSSPTRFDLLPISFKPKNAEINEKIQEYAVEPDPTELVDQLLKSFIEEKIRNFLIQAEAGEHSSRMISMKNATDNAEHVIYNLTLLRNKIRQEKITYELLDMMTSKESVEN